MSTKTKIRCMWLLFIGCVSMFITTMSHAGASSSLSFSKNFGGANVALNGSTSLTFVLSSGAGALNITGLAFTDTLPAGLVVSTPSGLAPTVCPSGGSITAVDGSSTISLAGGVLASPDNCTFSVNVTGTTAGIKNNSVTTSAGNMGNGNQIANATLTVLPAVVAVPTLSEWAMILFALMLLSYGLHRQRGRSSRALSPEEH